VDVSLRTPHGTADVQIVVSPPTATLRDLIAAITDQSAPGVVSVDGHAVETSTTLADGVVLWGSVIDSNPHALEPAIATSAALAQIAGPGAGRSHPLTPGRYRVGPGRRSNAEELDAAPVLETVMELVADAEGGISIEATGPAEVTLEGSTVQSSTNWSDGQIAIVGRRAFTIDRRPPQARRAGPPASFGTVLFSRPPRRPATMRLPVVEAVREAAEALPSLWERRLDQPDALSLCVGIADDPADRLVTVDLAGHRVVSIAGPAHSALARALIVEAATVHGPADLDVVIATTPRRLARWDWIKWLPHLRVGGRRRLFDDPVSMSDWARDAVERATPDGVEWSAGHVTLVVVDDPELWQRRGSPLHTLVSSPPAHLRLLTTCDTARQAPASASLLLDERADGTWQLTSPTSRREARSLLAALVDVEVAAGVARSLAPLADHELVSSGTTTLQPRRSLEEFVTHDGGEPLVDLLLASGGARVCGPAHETTRTAAALALRLCSARSAAVCWLLDLTGSAWTGGLDGLANTSPHGLDPSAVDPERLLARLRHHLGGTDRPELVLVLVDLSDVLGARLVTELGDLDGVLVLAVDSATSTVDGTQLPTISVDRVDGRRRGRCDRLDSVVELDDDEAAEGLVLQPAVYGRALTPLERHVARQAAAGPEEFAAACRRIVATISTDRARPPVLAVPHLPAPLDIDAMLADHPGDAIPIGLVDDPADDHRTLWWEPGHGHLLAVGPAGTDVDHVVTTVLIGLVERFGDDDVRFVLVDADAARRSAAEASSRCLAALDRDDAAVGALLDLLGADDGARRVLVLDDVGDLRRRAEAVGLDARLDAALTASSDLAVVTIARSLDDLGPLAGVDGAEVVVAFAERCRRRSTGDLVQLATFVDDPGAGLADRLGTPGGIDS
jgi:hypothetical protein